ncbi:MAG: protein-L-isoaspartate O-methyltransferase [Candidatus Vogelbacteria bacterium CG10_big_fil_rev_8_21_14_0_10_50_13]|uniref:Protein-L-isoaspartate O-methyltransferase n=1 Tax=Candidatus Vogelbacteria bacterium CG10_big_fil_rev_8_21_14_0_10_50_13 TaxID=1975044 RepID=A0A2H0RGL4_9BACT|nr:MAG: protein-L-isoaspartate O-methyltransferase [Candidatus Vogelbacteria bacterium CG10_big_fil_rev_8_21_14_0_10_50_13]
MEGKLLANHLQGTGVLKDPLLISAFKAISRADFVRPEDKPYAYIDEPRQIGFGQTISQPTTVAFMLELLTPRPGQKILDVGAGSGYQSALLGRVVAFNEFGEELPANQRGKVIGLEFRPELATMARQNLARYGLIAKQVVAVHCLNAAKGYPAEAPYDGIISAAAAAEVPRAWQEQLAPGGKIVMPINSTILQIIKEGPDKFVTHRFEGYSFVPFVPDVEPDE